jgi:sulfur-oxidizing protein SoxX
MTALQRAAWVGTTVLALAAALPAAAFEVVGDGIPQPLTATPGDPARGRAIVADRRVGLCLLCHSGPIPEERFQGNLAPPLDGAGKRWTAAQLRMRIADARALNPNSLMPAFHRPAPQQADARRVAAPFRGQPLLTAQQVEDVVAWLETLQ